MSRSYRKPYVKDGYGTKWKKRAKNYANRTIRRSKKDIPSGNAYKKFYCSWNICDYRWKVDEPRPEGRWLFGWFWESFEEMLEEYNKVRRK